MDDLTKIVVTSVASFAVGYFLKFADSKSKLIMWSSHAFRFDSQQNNLAIFTRSLTIQNAGKKIAQNIQVAHRTRPQFFQLFPSLNFTEVNTPDGKHVIQINALSPKEWVTVEVLGTGGIPDNLYVRCDDGYAQIIPIQPNRISPRWFLWLSWTMVFVGTGFSIYWLIRAIYFISSSF